MAGGLPDGPAGARRTPWPATRTKGDRLTTIAPTLCGPPDRLDTDCAAIVTVLRIAEWDTRTDPGRWRRRFVSSEPMSSREQGEHVIRPPCGRYNAAKGEDAPCASTSSGTRRPWIDVLERNRRGPPAPGGTVIRLTFYSQTTAFRRQPDETLRHGS